MSENKTTGRFGRIMKTLYRGLKHLFLHNGWVKLLAVLISLILWAGLISQDEKLTRDKTFQNVSVTVSGADTLRRSGYIVTSDLDEKLNSVNVTAAVPQLQYDAAEASAYNIRLDLSKITGPGEQEVKILSSTSSTYGRVTGIAPSSITVEVEEYLERPRIPVTVSINGDAPEGWYISSTTLDSELIVIAISGPRTLVQTISRAKVIVDTDALEWTEGSQWTSADIRLYNRSGEEVVNPLLTVSADSKETEIVNIEINILPKRAYYVKDNIQISGSVAEGYEITDVRVSPETISIAARGEVLEQLSDLPMERTVNVSGITETGVYQLKVQKPSDDAILSNETITVTVEVCPREDNP